jgi:c-di-GMP phosphodiesterase
MPESGVAVSVEHEPDSDLGIWRRAVSALGLWTLTVDAAGTICEVNDVLLDASGLERAAITGAKLWELAADPHEQALLRDRVFPMELDEAPPGFILRVKAAGGESHVVEWGVVPLDGEPRRILLAGVDRTSGTPGFESLQNDRDWYRKLLGQLPAVLWTTDRDLVFTASAGAGLALLGVGEGQLVGVPLDRYFAGTDDPNIGHHRRALAGETVRYDTEWLGRAYQTVLVPLRAAGDDEVIGTIGLSIDITDRVRAEAERDRSLEAERDARVRAEQALRARDEFISIAAHELYTPMTSLQLALQSVLSRDVEGDTAKRLLGLAEKQTQRLLRLIQDLLDVSRIHTRQMHLRPSEGDLAELARHVGARFSPEFERADTSLTVHADEAVVGVWDIERIDQIMTNLLTNAMRHAPGTTVDLEVHAVGDRVRITVSDRGPGVTDDFAARIFDRFERAASTEHHGGLGLGLYIVRQIAEAHGGTAAVSARPGGGAEFSVELPIASEADESEAP